MKVKNNSNNKMIKKKNKISRKKKINKGKEGKKGREIEKRRKRINDCFFFLNDGGCRLDFKNNLIVCW